MSTTALFKADLIPRTSQALLPEGYTLRPLARDDHAKGYFECLNSLTWTGDVSEERFQERFDWLCNESRDWYYVVVIEKEGQIIANGVLIIEQKFIWNLGAVGHLEEICVRKDFQGQGLGKILIEAINGLAQNRECLKTILNCSEENEKFYSKCGYNKASVEMARKFDGAETDGSSSE